MRKEGRVLELRGFANCLVSWRVDDARTRAWGIEHVGMAEITIDKQ